MHTVHWQLYIRAINIYNFIFNAGVRCWEMDDLKSIFYRHIVSLKYETWWSFTCILDESLFSIESTYLKLSKELMITTTIFLVHSLGDSQNLTTATNTSQWTLFFLPPLPHWSRPFSFDEILWLCENRMRVVFSSCLWFANTSERSLLTIISNRSRAFWKEYKKIRVS